MTLKMLCFIYALILLQSCAQFVTEQLSIHFQHLNSFLVLLRTECGMNAGSGDGARQTKDAAASFNFADLIPIVEGEGLPNFGRKLNAMIEKVVNCTSFICTFANHSTLCVNYFTLSLHFVIRIVRK